MNDRRGGKKGQSSFELLMTLSLGLAVLLPLVVLAFIQLASANSTISSVEAQQAATKLSSYATLVGSEGYPAKEQATIQVPSGVQSIYVGNSNNQPGHEVIFVIRSPVGPSYITAYTPVNVSGDLGGITASGTYLINVTAEPTCQNGAPVPCVYMSLIT